MEKNMADWDWGICVECAAALDDDYDTLCDECASQYDSDLSDVEADAATLASAGWGTDEDYGYFGDDGW